MEDQETRSALEFSARQDSAGEDHEAIICNALLTDPIVIWSWSFKMNIFIFFGVTVK